MSPRCLLPLFLSFVYGVQGATLREHRLSEPASYEPGSQFRPPPSAEMLKAIRYIQNLSQRTGSEPPVDDRQAADLEPDDLESMRSMLRLAAPMQGSAQMDRDLEEREDDNDKTQQWLQAVLSTLQQTEEQMVPQKIPQMGQASSPPRPRYLVEPRPKQQLESDENYERSSWASPSNRRRQRQYPLMFEEDEDQEQPLKRTNENAEEQYTPQKLATLQSVFEELSGISTAKTGSKRHEEDGDEDYLYRQRKMALEDIMGTDEWEPLEEQTEMEEDQTERHGSDDDEDAEDEVKRSNKPDFFTADKDDSDIAKLVDLLKLLESREQKREELNDEEEENREKKYADDDENEEEVEDRDEEEREIKPLHESFPQSLSQLISISQKLQIPPADVLDLLQHNPRDFRIPVPARTYNPRKTYASAPHQLQTSHSVAQDILSILEMVSAAQQNHKLPQRPVQSKPSRYNEKERDLPRYGFSETSRDDYDDTTGEEDELASFLASEMLTQGPRRARQMPPDYGTLKRAVQNYFDKNAAEKRSEKHKSAATRLDDETMMRILRYLEPESDDETDSDNKSVPGM